MPAGSGPEATGHDRLHHNRGRDQSEGEYGRHSREAYQPHRNPFTPWERATLMRLGLAEYGLQDQVTVSVAPRHDIGWDLAADFYPADRIICLTAKDEFEKVKADLWLSRGERVHVFSDLGADVLTTTEIRRRVASGKDWRNYIPPASHTYFTEIDGPHRAFGTGSSG
jgi:nicotinamide mononucleotide adenylyltransferase